jgi:hypothetical protein
MFFTDAAFLIATAGFYETETILLTQNVNFFLVRNKAFGLL